MRPAATGGADGDAPALGVLNVTEQLPGYSPPSLVDTSPSTFIVTPTVGSTKPVTPRLVVPLPLTLAWEISRFTA
jgi:hypothetical protein